MAPTMFFSAFTSKHARFHHNVGLWVLCRSRPPLGFAECQRLTDQPPSASLLQPRWNKKRSPHVAQQDPSGGDRLQSLWTPQVALRAAEAPPELGGVALGSSQGSGIDEAVSILQVAAPLTSALSSPPMRAPSPTAAYPRTPPPWQAAPRDK